MSEEEKPKFQEFFSARHTATYFINLSSIPEPKIESFIHDAQQKVCVPTNDEHNKVDFRIFNSGGFLNLCVRSM
jgi:hypothetical protein